MDIIRSVYLGLVSVLILSAAITAGIMTPVVHVEAAPSSSANLNKKTCASIFDGAWHPKSKTCMLKGNVTLNSDVTVPKGTSLQVSAPHILTISNSGVLTIATQGALVKIDTPGGAGTAPGSISNYGNLFNRGGTIHVNGSVLNHGHMYNVGGTIENSGVLKNEYTGTIHNVPRSFINTQTGSIIHNEGGMIINEGIMGVKGMISNIGVINNSGTINSRDGLIVNYSGTINGVLMAGTINNFDVIHIDNATMFVIGGSVNNYGILIVTMDANAMGIMNSATAIINNLGSIVVSDTATNANTSSSGIINDGMINNTGMLTIASRSSVGMLNVGNIENSATIHIRVDARIENGTPEMGGVINNNAGGEIDNAGTVDNTYGFMFNKCGSSYSGNAPIGNSIVYELCV